VQSASEHNSEVRLQTLFSYKCLTTQYSPDFIALLCYYILTVYCIIVLLYPNSLLKPSVKFEPAFFERTLNFQFRNLFM
jgi:hypothetical protein